MTDAARSVAGISKRTAGISIMLLGVFLALLHGWHYVDHSKPFIADLFGVIVPVALSLAVVYAGFWTLRRPDRYGWFFRVWIWTYAGTIGMAAIAGLIVLHQFYAGRFLEDSLYILATTATGGALGGFLIGIFEAQNWRRRKRIEAIHGATRALMNAQTPEKVSELAVSIAEEALDMPLICIWLHDDGCLEPVAVTDTGRQEIGEPPVYTSENSLSWQAFEDGETRIVTDMADEAKAYNPNTLARSELIIPLGEIGVMNIGSKKPGAFEEIDITTAEILAATTTAAIQRAMREEELRTHQAELERQTEQLDNFARTLSHDLRNPLSVAIGRVELANRTGDQSHLADATAALDRMSAFIDDLLTLARQGQQIGELEAVSIRVICDAAWSYVETKDATLSIQTDLTLCCDPDRLQQLFENLFRNAVEHGGADVTITVGETDTGIFIEDSGEGFKTDDRDRLFETGYTTDETGTGYGLSIVQQIVDAHGWTISAHDATTGGARFEISGIEAAEQSCCVEE